MDSKKQALVEIERQPTEVTWKIRVNGKLVATASNPFTAGLFAASIEKSLETVGVQVTKKGWES